MRAIIAGGGTTGHLSPGLAVAEVLRERGAEILFIGTPGGPEARIVPAEGYTFRSVAVIGRGPGTLSVRNLKAGSRLLWATVASIRILRQFRPEVVVGTGGYVSLPATVAAWMLRVPVVVHEQNSVPGLANRVARRFARAVGVSFPGTEALFGPRAHLVGNPVGRAMRDFDRNLLGPAGRQEFGLQDGRPTLLVFGGSQGAQSINRAVLGAYDGLRRSDLQILHLVGLRNELEVSAAVERLRLPSDNLRYRVVGYTDSMPLAYACSDLALCRAGASTVAELATAALPAALVPLPISLDDDQRLNAKAVVEAGGGRLVLDKDLKPTVVVELVKGLLSAPAELERMKLGISSLARPDAAEHFADLIERAVAEPCWE